MPESLRVCFGASKFAEERINSARLIDITAPKRMSRFSLIQIASIQRIKGTTTQFSVHTTFSVAIKKAYLGKETQSPQEYAGAASTRTFYPLCSYQMQNPPRKVQKPPLAAQRSRRVHGVQTRRCLMALQRAGCAWRLWSAGVQRRTDFLTILLIEVKEAST